MDTEQLSMTKIGLSAVIGVVLNLVLPKTKKNDARKKEKALKTRSFSKLFLFFLHHSE